MEYTYDINTSKKDNRANVCIFICHFFYAVIDLFISTFLVAHIKDLTTSVGEYIRYIAIYYMITLTVQLVAYPIISRIVDRTNRVWMYRIGCLMLAVVVTLSMFSDKNTLVMLIILGSCYGVADTAYYASYNTMKQEMVSRKSIEKFSYYMTIISKCIDVVVPLTLGSIIQSSSFVVGSIVVAIIAAIQVGVSFGVSAKHPKGSKFNMRGFIRKVRSRPALKKKLDFLYAIFAGYGFLLFFSICMNVFTMLHMDSNLSLGIIKSSCSVIAILFTVMSLSLGKIGKRTPSYIICAILPVIAGVIYAINPCEWTIIFFTLAFLISYIECKTTLDYFRNTLLKEAGLYSEITEHQTLIEMLLATVRLFTFALLLAMSFVGSELGVNILACIFTLAFPFIYIMLIIFEKKILPIGTDADIAGSNDASDVQTSEDKGNLKNN